MGSTHTPDLHTVLPIRSDRHVPFHSHRYFFPLVGFIYTCCQFDLLAELPVHPFLFFAVLHPSSQPMQPLDSLRCFGGTNVTVTMRRSIRLLYIYRHLHTAMAT